MELTLRLVTTLATTVPTLFMRLKPASSIAKPACMNITRQPVTITQTVSAATPAACVAVRSSAMTAIGTNVAATVTAAASRRISCRFIKACWNAFEGLRKVPSRGGDPPARSQPMAPPGRSKTCGCHKVSSAAFVRRARSAPACGYLQSCGPHVIGDLGFVPSSPCACVHPFLPSSWGPSNPNPKIQEGVFMAIVTKSGSKTSPREVLERAKAEGVEVVDVRFVDLPGTWQHFSLPLGELDEGSFAEGLGFDGSSIRGFQSIDESDMLLIPDPDSATIDPVLSHKTLFLICDVIDPITREPSSRDARLIAKKAEEYLLRAGIADVSYWGPEAEFYIFNSLRFDQNAFSGYYYIDSEEGILNSGRYS